MGFSVSASTVVVFLAVLLAFGTFQAAVAESTEQHTEATHAVEERRLDRANTDVELVAVDQNVTTGRLVVQVTNTGSVDLSVSEVDLLVDNQYVEANTSVGAGSMTDLWLPGETLRLETTTTNATRVRVVTGTGVARSGAV